MRRLGKRKPSCRLGRQVVALLLCDARAFRMAKWLQRRNHKHNFAFWRMSFVLREKFAGGAAPEFFEFLGELARHTELSIRHNVDARAQRFRQTIWRFEKNCGFVAFDGCS
jgi:hypothetical protein